MRKILLICLLVFPAVASAYDYWPIHQGYSQEYVCLENPNFSFIGEIVGEVDGNAEYRHFFYEFGEVVSEFSYLLSVDDDGSVIIHGQSLPGTSIMPFEPPGVLVQAPLHAGLTWEAEAELVGVGMFHMACECVDEGYLTVPAGTCYCYHVVRTVSMGGTVIEVIEDWFAEGIGIVKHHIGSVDQTYVLVAPVGVEPSSWSGVKALYRSQ